MYAWKFSIVWSKRNWTCPFLSMCLWDILLENHWSLQILILFPDGASGLDPSLLVTKHTRKNYKVSGKDVGKKIVTKPTFFYVESGDLSDEYIPVKLWPQWSQLCLSLHTTSQNYLVNQATYYTIPSAFYQNSKLFVKTYTAYTIKSRKKTRP